MKAKLNLDHPDYHEDFREEIGVTEELIAFYGNIVLFSPERHSEVAGAGIENDRVVSKNFSGEQPTMLPEIVRFSLSKVTLPVAKTRQGNPEQCLRLTPPE